MLIWTILQMYLTFAGLADKDGGEIIDSPIPNTESKVVKEPVGVVTQITPWNYPLLQASWKIAPALATGCSLVMKPSEITPLTTIRVFELMEEVGFPKGVINLVLGKGSEVGEPLSSHKDVDLVSFTGGIQTGKHIMKQAADHVTNVALELGGKILILYSLMQTLNLQLIKRLMVAFPCRTSLFSWCQNFSR